MLSEIVVMGALGFVIGASLGLMIGAVFLVVEWTWLRLRPRVSLQGLGQ